MISERGEIPRVQTSGNFAALLRFTFPLVLYVHFPNKTTLLNDDFQVKHVRGNEK